MRLVNVDDLEEGMIVAKPIYNENGRCLVNIGFELNSKTIQRIGMLDYERLWIKDEYDYINDYLSDELKLKTVRCIKSVFTGYASKKVKFDLKKIDELKEVIENVVDEIMINNQCVIQLSNLRNFNNNMYEHAVDVARVSVLIGVNMNLPKDKLVNLCEAAMLHDIGKTFIDSELVNKNTEFTKEEIDEINKHSILSYEIMKATGKFSIPSYVPSLQHHERYDGTGYPNGIKGEKINLYARIIQIANVYSNMRTGTSNTRTYSQSEVLEYFYADGSKQFDPKILKIFFDKVPIYEVGQIIKLSNGKKAFVIQNNEKALARPLLRVLDEGNTLGEEIDLSLNNNITIIL